MCFALNLIPQYVAAASSTVGPNHLSEAELLSRYPVIAEAAAVLLSLGVICDLYLLFRYAKPAPANGPAAPVSALKIDPKPWSLRDLWFATGALVLVLVAGDGIVMLALKLARLDYDGSLPWLLVTDVLLRLTILCGFVGFFRRRGIDWQQALGLRRNAPLHAIASGVIFFLAVLPPLAVVFAGSSKLCQLVGIPDDPQPVADMLATTDSNVVVALIVGFAVAVAPVFEEFFFRGFAYPALKQRWGTWQALLTVSIVFAAIHFHVPSLGPLLALAIGLGLAYELTGSLLAPITMHVLFNAVNVAMLLYARAHS
jgi:membrane protease YdiL (CAAX protease family)